MSCRTRVNPPQPQIVARIELREAPDVKLERVTYQTRDNDVPVITIYRAESP